MGEPGEDGVLPNEALVVVGDDVVLALHLNIADGATEDAQGREELLALVRRHVGVDCAVEQEQGRVNLVGIEERRMLHVEVGIVPGIGTILSRFAIGIAPVATAPIAGDVGDARVGDGGGEDVRARLQVLRHKAAVTGTHTTYFLAIDEGVGRHELLGSFDDVIARTFAPGAHVAGSKFLAVADGAAWVERIDHVALACQHLEGILKLQRLGRWRATAIIIDNERVFLRGIKVGWQEIETIDAVAARTLEFPVVAASDGHTLVHLVEVHLAHMLGLGLGRGEGAQIHIAGTLARLSEEDGGGVLLAQGDGVAAHTRDGQLVLDDLARLRVEAEEAQVLAIRGVEINHTIHGRPFRAVHGRGEVAEQGLDGLGVNVVEVEARVEILGLLAFAHLAANAVEGCGAGADKEAASVGRELCAADEGRIVQERIHATRLHVHTHECCAVEGLAVGAHVAVGEQELLAVLGDVAQPNGLLAVGQLAIDTRVQVVVPYGGAVAPARHTVVGVVEAAQAVALLLALGCLVVDDVVLGGR